MVENKRYYGLIIKIVVSISLMTWFFKSIKWDEIISLLYEVNLMWIFCAFIWVGISVLVSAYKWQFITRASGLKLPFRVLWRSYWAGLFFNNFLPSSIGGDALRIYWAGKYAEDMSGVTTSVVAERILATIGLALIALMVIPFANLYIPYLPTFFFLVATVGFVLLLFILYPKVVDGLQRVFSSWTKCKNFLQGISIHGKRLKNNRRLLLQSLVWSVIFQVCVIMVNYCIFKSLNINQVSLVKATVVIPATSVAAMVPLGINGYGTREGAYIALLSYLNVSKAEAITASIIFALVVSISSLWGGWIWIREGKSKQLGGNYEELDTGESSQLFC